MAMLAALCSVIVPKVTSLLSAAVTRRQTQTCCGFQEGKKKRKGLCLEQDVENEFLLIPHEEIPVESRLYAVHKVIQQNSEFIYSA